MLASIRVLSAVFFLVIAITIAISNEKYPEFPLKSTAAHESSTGAPGELTCAQSGCHETSEIQRDDTTNALLFSDADSTYGDSMEGVTLRVRRKDCKKFGFQIVCLDTLMKNVGSWVLLNKERVQMQLADFSVPGATGRKYLTHTYKGTIPQSTGEIFWEFSWLPPLNGYKGAVTFYVMTNCTNNDNTNSGDALYASKHTLRHQSSATSLTEEIKHQIISFQTTQGTWSLPLPINERMKSLEICDLSGKHLSCTWESKGQSEIEISLENQRYHGLVMIKMSMESGLMLKKAVFFHD